MNRLTIIASCGLCFAGTLPATALEREVGDLIPAEIVSRSLQHADMYQSIQLNGRHDVVDALVLRKAMLDNLDPVDTPMVEGLAVNMAESAHDNRKRRTRYLGRLAEALNDKASPEQIRAIQHDVVNLFFQLDIPSSLTPTPAPAQAATGLTPGRYSQLVQRQVGSDTTAFVSKLIHAKSDKGSASRKIVFDGSRRLNLDLVKQTMVSKLPKIEASARAPRAGISDRERYRIEQAVFGGAEVAVAQLVFWLDQASVDPQTLQGLSNLGRAVQLAGKTHAVVHLAKQAFGQNLASLKTVAVMNCVDLGSQIVAFAMGIGPDHQIAIMLQQMMEAINKRFDYVEAMLGGFQREVRIQFEQVHAVLGTIRNDLANARSRLRHIQRELDRIRFSLDFRLDNLESMLREESAGRFSAAVEQYIRSPANQPQRYQLGPEAYRTGLSRFVDFGVNRSNDAAHTAPSGLRFADSRNDLTDIIQQLSGQDLHGSADAVLRIEERLTGIELGDNLNSRIPSYKQWESAASQYLRLVEQNLQTFPDFDCSQDISRFQEKGELIRTAFREGCSSQRLKGVLDCYRTNYDECLTELESINRDFTRSHLLGVAWDKLAAVDDLMLLELRRAGSRSDIRRVATEQLKSVRIVPSAAPLRLSATFVHKGRSRTFPFTGDCWKNAAFTTGPLDYIRSRLPPEINAWNELRVRNELPPLQLDITGDLRWKVPADGCRTNFSNPPLGGPATVRYRFSAFPVITFSAQISVVEDGGETKSIHLGSFCETELTGLQTEILSFYAYHKSGWRIPGDLIKTRKKGKVRSVHDFVRSHPDAIEGAMRFGAARNLVSGRMNPYRNLTGLMTLIRSDVKRIRQGYRSELSYVASGGRNDLALTELNYVNRERARRLRDQLRHVDALKQLIIRHLFIFEPDFLNLSVANFELRNAILAKSQDSSDVQQGPDKAMRQVFDQFPDSAHIFATFKPNVSAAAAIDICRSERAQLDDVVSRLVAFATMHGENTSVNMIEATIARLNQADRLLTGVRQTEKLRRQELRDLGPDFDSDSERPFDKDTE